VNKSSSHRKDPVIDPEEVFTKPVKWLDSVRQIFYEPKRDNTECYVATNRLIKLREKFNNELIERAERARALKTPFQFPPRKGQTTSTQSPSVKR